ncbi:MAG: PKD domain-containing protein [Anaerolineae bacterium]|nr:PKD domain-containing protein [Anaerolineae bacterium]
MKTRLLHLIVLSIVTLVLTGLLVAIPALAGPGLVPPAQGGSPAWIIWEMDYPPQRLLLNGDTLWVGSYKGGLYRWDIETGYQARYTTADGLAGDDIVGLALNGSGSLLAAALDGGLVVGNASFFDLTPPGGERAWDVAVGSSGDIWLASLGGGVAHYNGSAWTVYTATHTGLPTNDIYAVALDDTTPWIGTMGYGLAAFNGSNWVTYTLPVNIAHPVTPTISISNNAVADIAVDAGGNKWLATDGSGVVVLDSGHTNWTVYNTANSSLPDDFVHAITLNGDERWFGALGGGVARLDTGSGTWDVLNTTNSLLPEDDVLDVAIDGNGGQWFATFDTGLSYHGPLPATPPLLDVDPRGVPEYEPGQAKNLYLWLDPDTYLWRLACSGENTSTHTFAGSITANAPILSATPTDFEAGDSVTVNGNTLTLTATEAISQDLVSFVLDRSATELTIDLKIDGAYRPFNIKIGEAQAMPGTAPFQLVPPQPVPPEVQAGEAQTLEEGQLLLLTAILTDTDSPVGHTIAWDMDDGGTITGTLAPTHLYEDDGSFNVTLAVTDVHDEVGSAIVPVTVTNVAPFVDFYSEPYRPEPNQTITFTDYVDDSGLADTHTYEWDFGDGNTATGTSLPPGGTEGGITVTHSYAITGDYAVTLTVADDDGGVGVVSYTLSVEPFGADFTGYPGVGLPPFTATFFDTSSGMVVTRTWDFGDSSSPVITTADNIEHLYDTPGIYDVSLTIKGPSDADTVSRTGYIIAVSPLTSGTIILEAEDYTRLLPGPGPTWETRTAGPSETRFGHAGLGYVYAGPDVDTLFGPEAIAAGAELQYDLGLTITGTYTVWLRGYAPNAAGDSVYVGLNSWPITPPDYVSAYPPGAWTWTHTLAESGQPITFTLDYPAVHTLNLWLREDGFSLDQITLTTEESFNPAD